MGYTTKLYGTFFLDKRLFDSQVLYLLEFANTRRMKRDVAILQNAPDLAREAVGLPLGEDGCYFVNEEWDKDSEASIVNYNLPPAGQPGLWCNWVPNSDGSGIQWNGREKFYHYIEWLQYIINNFLQPWGYLLNGEVNWEGEDPADIGHITVVDNKITWPEGAEELLQYAVSPVQIPLAIFQVLETIQASGTPLINWHEVMDRAEALGYPEIERWIKTNPEKFFDGLKRGFEANGKVLESDEMMF